jgi:hypothetical protein
MMLRSVIAQRWITGSRLLCHSDETRQFDTSIVACAQYGSVELKDIAALGDRKGRRPLFPGERPFSRLNWGFAAAGVPIVWDPTPAMRSRSLVAALPAVQG